MFLLVFSTGFEVEADGGGMVTITVIVSESLESDSGLEEAVDVRVKKVEEVDGTTIVIYDKTIVTDHFATFEGVPVGGSCTITGGTAPGYVAPELVKLELTKFKGNFNRTVNLVYERSEEGIPVSGIEIDKTDMTLLEGRKGTITASVIPENASIQNVEWTSNNTDVAVVSEKGEVTAVLASEDKVEITAKVVDTTTSEGKEFSATCTVTVKRIGEVLNPEPIHAIVGEVVKLPDIVEVELNDGTTEYVDVNWIGAYTVGEEQVIQYDKANEDGSSYILTGEIEGTDYTASLEIYVTGEPVLSVESVDFVDALDGSVSIGSVSVFTGQTTTIGMNIEPDNADIEPLEWKWSYEPVDENNSTVATVAGVTAGDSAAEVDFAVTILGVAPGKATLYVEKLDGTVLDSCLVNVALDPTITDPAYIAATTTDSPEPVDQFESKEDVYIRCYNLPAGEYYVKVEEQGSQVPLGETNETDENENNDRIVVGAEDAEVIFNLYEATGFKDSTKNSKSYFVSMSKNPEYPSGDDADGIPNTFMDNFKITSPVPTGFIVVDVHEDGYSPISQEFYESYKIFKIDENGDIVMDENGDPVVEEIDEIDVILGREIKDKTAEETQYSDYLNPGYETDPTLPKYTDEAKLIGHVNANGKVTWEEPKEVLKIGGYILLIELPKGYASNLDAVNPESEDGELLKEVHITRNNTVIRTIEVFK
ncbi:Ig-like domain-containing protein [Peptoclostridium litorale]|uniref:Ig-like domain-containing protein n=1 Tax=Peptoclostridium litorale TaxID=1557 RepID=UPI001A9A3C93|nr:Ig-like domain-containing protein [Peptoclostridium litorale]